MPVAVTTNSPCWRWTTPAASAAVIATGLTGSPAKRSRRWSLQPPRSGPVGATSKPQLLARSGAMARPRAASSGTQAPSEPRRDQLAPPSASTVASAANACSPSGPAKRRVASSPAQPSQRWRMWNCTPPARSRCSQARSNGAAFMSLGNTRPDVPTKVRMPSSAAHARTASGPKSSRYGASAGSRAA